MGFLSSTVDYVAAGAAPTTANSNISGFNNNAAPTITQSSDFRHPTSKTSITKWSAASAAPAAQMFWDAAKWQVALSGTVIWGRVDMYFPAANSGTVGLLGGITTASANQWSIRASSAQKLSVYNGSTSVGTMLASIPLSTWFSVGFRTFYSGTTGTVQAWLFPNTNTGSYTETVIGTAGNTGGGSPTVQRMYLGNVGGGTSSTHYYANARWSDTGPVSPSAFVGWGLGGSY